MLIFWVGCLFSINSKISDLYVDNKNFFSTTIVFIRVIIPILIFAILIFFFQIKKLNLFILSYLTYALWQLIVYTPNKEHLIDSLERYHLIVSMLAILLIIHITAYFKFTNLHLKILYFSIFFISAVSFYLSFFIVGDFIADNNVFYLYTNSTLISEGRNLLQTNPRITGVSRMLGLVLLFIFSIYICKKKNLFLTNFFFLSAIFIISFLIYGMQSKGSYISILLLLFIVLILPAISFETLLKIKIEYLKTSEFLKTNIVKSRFLSNNSIEINGEIIKDYTTGRFEIWKRAIKKIKEEKIFLGKGPQSDRLLLTSINFDPKIPGHFFDSNASNGLIYSYLCAGIIGLLFILTVYSLILYEVYKSIFIKKAFANKNSYAIFSIITLSFLSVRTIYENGFTYFGIDYVFTAICYLILKKFNSIKNTKNYSIL